MLTLTVRIESHNEGDLDLALQEISKQVACGMTSGQDRNSEGHYHFSLEGEDDWGRLSRDGWEEEDDGELSCASWRKGAWRRLSTADAVRVMEGGAPLAAHGDC